LRKKIIEEEGPQKAKRKRPGNLRSLRNSSQGAKSLK
jgi:hypothetical protein